MLRLVAARWRLSATASPRLAGIGLMVVTGFFFACLDSSAKWLGRDLPTPEVVWARYLSNFLIVLPFVNPWTTPTLLRPRRPVMQGMRGLVILLSTILNFVALHYLQLAQTVSINFSTPLIVAALAGPILGERVGWRRAAAIIIGFIGVVIVTQPGAAGFHWAMLLSIVGAFAYAAGNIMARILVKDDPTAVTLFYVGAVGTVVMAPAVPFGWVWPNSALAYGLMLLMGAAGAIGHHCLILAHKFAPASILAPFIYTQLVWMVLSGWLLFGDVPDHATLAGAAIVIASGIYLLWRERRVTGRVRTVPDPDEPF
jgi:drug/metabolite transporter (DMT)-like permease